MMNNIFHIKLIIVILIINTLLLSVFSMFTYFQVQTNTKAITEIRATQKARIEVSNVFYQKMMDIHGL